MKKRKHARASTSFARRRPWASRISSIRRSPAPTERQAFRISTASSRSRRRSDGRACRSRSWRRSSSWRTFSPTTWRPASHKGSIAMAVPATRRLQQIAVADIAQFTALVIERRESFLGKRIDIASDELTLTTAAAAISEASGRHIEYTALPIDSVRQWSEDQARMSSGSTAWDTTRTSSACDRSIPKSTGTASAPGLASRIGQPSPSRRQQYDLAMMRYSARAQRFPATSSR